MRRRLCSLGFAALFSEMVAVNEEGAAVSTDAGRPTVGIPFTEAASERLRTEPLSRSPAPASNWPGDTGISSWAHEGPGHGAAEFVGYAVAALLTEQGHQVTGLTRSRTSALPTGVQRLHGDLRTPDTLPTALAEVDVVCHLAGLTKLRESRIAPLDYWRTNLGHPTATPPGSSLNS